ncbi:MAG: T9SS type A sorting domain-containing protein [Paludibacteraceae bacterium]|nr:T9SS type A sorting domain-containing protein [Paludibacteraceae bacterium]
MKKHLLSLAMLAGLVSPVSADEIYIIKDGKLADGVEVLEYDDPLDGPVVKETTSPDGEAAVSITHQLYCTEARFYKADGIDLKKAWNIEIEYYFEEVDSVTHSGANKWEIIDLGYHTDTTGNRYSLKDIICQNTFNVKNKATAKKWNVESQYVYAPASVTTLKEIIFGWQRQIGVTGKPNTDEILALKPVYIKNMKFVGKGNKPFFAEDFEGFSSVSAEAANGLNYYVVKDGEVREYEACGFKAGDVATNPWKCETAWYTVENSAEGGKYSNKQISLDAKRLYEDEGNDGSEYYDTEILHALDIVLPANAGKRTATGLNGRAFTLIPTKGLEATEEVTMEFLSKWDASRTTEVFAEDADSLILPIYYAYVDDAVEASTVELSAANKVTKEPLASMWTEYSAKFPFNKSKKYLAVIFDKAPFLSYVVDNLRLTSDAVSCAEVVSSYPEGVSEYNDVDVIAAESESLAAVVSPVPATDVITVNNEGVVSVEVVNALGSVVAKAEGNQVNVASLASGMYIVKAQTVNGVATAKIIKK